jgi:DNA-binding NtrC family response regulator
MTTGMNMAEHVWNDNPDTNIKSQPATADGSYSGTGDPSAAGRTHAALFGAGQPVFEDADGRVLVTAANADEVVSLDELERRYILRVIKLVEGNKSRAAQLLGLDRRTLYRKLDRYRRAEGMVADGLDGDVEHHDTALQD